MRVELLLEHSGLNRQEILVIKACTKDSKSFEATCATLVEHDTGVHPREGRSLGGSNTWQRLVNQPTPWQNPHIQHDVCEFLSHLSHLLPAALVSPSWLSRPDDEGGHRDEGITWPLPLSLPDQRVEIHLQELVSARESAGPSRLCRAPAAVALQVKRYMAQGAGVFKTMSCLHSPRRVTFHIGEAQVQYEPVAVIVHVGSLLNSGHYRTYFPQFDWYSDDKCSS